MDFTVFSLPFFVVVFVMILIGHLDFPRPFCVLVDSS